MVNIPEGCECILIMRDRIIMPFGQCIFPDPSEIDMDELAKLIKQGALCLVHDVR